MNMENTEVSKPQEEAPILIDKRAFMLIKDEMHADFMYSSNIDITKMAIEALFNYIVRRGGKPGFKVTL